MQYDDFVTQTLENMVFQGNRELVLSIIYTETKGKRTDVMQSTESTHDTIETEEDSIHQGITNLTEMLEYAHEKERRRLDGRSKPITLAKPMSTISLKTVVRTP